MLKVVEEIEYDWRQKERQESVAVSIKEQDLKRYRSFHLEGSVLPEP